jgi:hypothetical protein
LKNGGQAQKWLAKKAKQGRRGYPIGTIAFYGPDDTRASKIVASVIARENSDPIAMRKWFSDIEDLRRSEPILAEVVTFLRENAVHTVAMVDRIIGCPHEEGIDYEGETCPHCAFWAGRDRWTGKMKN